MGLPLDRDRGSGADSAEPSTRDSREYRRRTGRQRPQGAASPVLGHLRIDCLLEVRVRSARVRRPACSDQSGPRNGEPGVFGDRASLSCGGRRRRSSERVTSSNVLKAASQVVSRPILLPATSLALSGHCNGRPGRRRHTLLSRARADSSGAPAGAPQVDFPIGIVRPFASGAFGMWTWRTPLSKVAVTASAETLRGTVKERSKRPKGRSWRW